MSVRLLTSLPVESLKNSLAGNMEKMEHGRLLVGKVVRVDREGTADINFAGIKARARGEELLNAGKRIFAHVRKTGGATRLSLLTDVKEGEVLSGKLLQGARARSGPLARFGKVELGVRLSANARPPAPGANVRAQVQLLGGKPTLQMLPATTSGGGLWGTVISIRADGMALMDIGGTTLVAESGGPLEPGEYVNARVRSLGGKWVLQATPRTASAGMDNAAVPSSVESRMPVLLGALASEELRVGGSVQELLALLALHFSKGGEKESWVSTLVRALEAILLSPRGENLAGQLAKAMENSGLFFESRLLGASFSDGTDPLLFGDLKLALLIAAQKLAHMQKAAKSAGRAQGLNEMAGRANALLDLITAEQIQNARLSPSGEFYLQIPLESESGGDSVEIHISPREKRGAGKIDARNILLTLAVSTSRLGRIKAALSIADGKMNCRLKAENQGVVNILSANSGALKQGLEKLNYEVTHIECVLGRDKADFSIIGELSKASSEGLDVRA